MTVFVRYSAHFHAVMRMLKAPANLHWLLHHDAMWVVVIHNENNVQKSCQKRNSGDVCAFSLIGVLGVEYSWGIRGVFVGYSWDIRMYRVCIGYVSGMYRESIERYKVRVGSYSNFVQNTCTCADFFVPLQPDWKLGIKN